MPIIIMAAATALLYLAQRLIYNALWSKGLCSSLDLGSDRYIFEGEKIEVEETLINDKALPLPWVYFKFVLGRNGVPTIYHSDMFCIANRRIIRRKRKFALDVRGVYNVTDLNLVSQDLFLTKTYACDQEKPHQTITVYPRLLEQEEWPISYRELMGEAISKRIFPEDPYLFKGIRDYQNSDSLKKVNFKASARTGEWKVNMNETTVSQKVAILLGMDKAARYYDPVLYENALRVAASLASAFEKEGIPVSLRSNGIDSLLKNSVRVEAGCGEGHIYEILEALARMDTEHEEGTIVAEMESIAQNGDRDTQYILICPGFRNGVKEAYEAMAEQFPESMWFLPCTVAQSRDNYFEPNTYGETVPGFSLWPD